MNIVSHYRMSRKLLKYLSREHGIKLHRIGFIFGNLKPDISGECFRRPHTTDIMDETFGDLTEFLKNQPSESISSRAYAVTLGTFCHYLSDFFCLAHNKPFIQDVWAHNQYELRLDVQVRKHAKIAPLEAIGNEADLLQKLLERHAVYRLSGQGVENDVNFIPSMCGLLCASAVMICKCNVGALAQHEENLTGVAYGLEAAL